MYKCEIQRNGTDEPIWKAEIKTDLENKCMDTKRGKEGGMNWEIGIDIYTLLILYIKWITSETYCIAQGTLLSALWSPKWERTPRKMIYVNKYLIQVAVLRK